MKRFHAAASALVILLAVVAVAQDKCPPPQPTSNAPDVPAIKVEQCYPGGSLNGYVIMSPSTSSARSEGSVKTCYQEDGCADKSRILLNAGDGKMWCHKVDTVDPHPPDPNVVSPAWVVGPDKDYWACPYGSGQEGVNPDGKPRCVKDSANTAAVR